MSTHWPMHSLFIPVFSWLNCLTKPNSSLSILTLCVQQLLDHPAAACPCTSAKGTTQLSSQTCGTLRLHRLNLVFCNDRNIARELVHGFNFSFSIHYTAIRSSFILKKTNKHVICWFSRGPITAKNILGTSIGSYCWSF